MALFSWLLIFVELLTVDYACAAFNLYAPMLLHNGGDNVRIDETARMADCNERILISCQKEFNQRLNVTSTADWTNHEVFRALIDTWLAKDVEDGLLELCKARSKFYSCLGASYASCMGRIFFLKRGFTDQAATAYVQIFKELEFICAGGILQSLQHWDCILSSQESSLEAYKACMKNYTDAMKENPSPSKRCTAAEELITCIRKPYHDNCGDDVGWWACERARLVIDTDNRCSHLSCSYRLFPVKGNQNPQQSQGKIRSKREAYSSLDPHFMNQQKMALYTQLGATAEQRLKRKKRSTEL